MDGLDLVYTGEGDPERREKNHLDDGRRAAEAHAASNGDAWRRLKAWEEACAAKLMAGGTPDFYVVYSGGSKEVVLAVEAVLMYLFALHYSLGLGGCNMLAGRGAPGMQEKILAKLEKLAAKLSGWDCPLPFKYARECLGFNK